MGLKPRRLTSAEYDLLIRLGMTNQQIADELGVTLGAINKRYYFLAGKFDVNTRTALVLKALRYRIVDIGDFII